MDIVGICMKILVVSYYYPPFNCIGSLRVGKMTKYLRKNGHEVKVLTCVQQLLPNDLKVEICADDILYTSWVNVNKVLQVAVGGERSVISTGYSVGSGVKARLLKRAGNVYKTFVNFPDGQVGWVPFACVSGLKLLREWTPDVIYASGLPISSLLVARYLSSRTSIPWVGELRDLWVDNSYRFMPAWRNRIEKSLERFIFRKAKGIVTVSKPLARVLQEKYDLPIRVVTNGFDEEDYCLLPDNEMDAKRFVIVYTGMVYEGRQDPTPLFAAIQMLQEVHGIRVTVRFYGRYLQSIRGLAKRFDIEANVEVFDPVSYHESLLVQSRADVVLLILGKGDGEEGVFTGKFFEYLRSLRPILAVGGTENVAAEVIFKRGAGRVLDDSDAIAAQLLDWHTEKELNGKLVGNKRSVAVGFSREEQARILGSFLADCLER